MRRNGLLQVLPSPITSGGIVRLPLFNQQSGEVADVYFYEGMIEFDGINFSEIPVSGMFDGELDTMAHFLSVPSDERIYFSFLMVFPEPVILNKIWLRHRSNGYLPMAGASSAFVYVANGNLTEVTDEEDISQPSEGSLSFPPVEPTWEHAVFPFNEPSGPRNLWLFTASCEASQDDMSTSPGEFAGNTRIEYSEIVIEIAS